MNKICTSLEQSKKLLELGIDVNTADMYFEPSTGFCTEPSEVRVGDIKYAHPRSIPAWNLSALLGLMPSLGYKSPKLVKNIFDNNWRCLYHRTAVSSLIHTQEYEEPIDAAFEMVVWLKENKKI